MPDTHWVEQKFVICDQYLISLEKLQCASNDACVHYIYDSVFSILTLVLCHLFCESMFLL